jgi:shikimate kinase
MAADVAARSGLVVATGGGVVLDPENLRVLAATGDLVCLTAEPETILQRVAGDATRPLLRVPDPLARIRSLLGKRRARYAAIPIQVPTDGLQPDEVAEAVLRRL